MKAVHPWHVTPLGRLVLWLGSIQFAVPTLVLVALALAWGTYIDSTTGARSARSAVYGSWWFIGLMALVCVSLIFAVISRFPWQRKHLGFMIVHASLVALIGAGFWSLFGRIEGRIALEQGQAGDSIETDREVLELVEHQAGEFKVLATVAAPRRPGRVSLGGVSLNITEHWDNCRQEVRVADDGPEPYRAIELAIDSDADKGVWIGDEAVGGPAKVEGIVVRVLRAGATFDAPDPAAHGTARFVFNVQGKQYPLGKVGDEAFPGWTIVSINEFSHAKVSASGITNTPEGEANPAIDVVITDNKGTSERHTAFEQFADINFTKTIEGTSRSGARLAPGAAAASQETLVVYGDPVKLTATHIDSSGAVTTRTNSGGLPWTFQTSKRRFTFLHDYARAQEISRFVQEKPVGDIRPALVVSIDGGNPTPIAWKGMLPAPISGRNTMLRFAPQVVTLPFSLTLTEFRKTDYPGTEMAMAYESAVSVNGHGGAPFDTTISMNKPLVQSGWKVYQSGFMGQTVSIFSVMRDPGLVLTYIACTGLCIGIFITFYARGHPGIPAPFARKEKHHVPFDLGTAPDPAVRADDPRAPVHTGVG